MLLLFAYCMGSISVSQGWYIPLPDSPTMQIHHGCNRKGLLNVHVELEQAHQLVDAAPNEKRTGACYDRGTPTISYVMGLFVRGCLHHLLYTTLKLIKLNEIAPRWPNCTSNITCVTHYYYKGAFPQ